MEQAPFRLQPNRLPRVLAPKRLYFALVRRLNYDIYSACLRTAYQNPISLFGIAIAPEPVITPVPVSATRSM